MLSTCVYLGASFEGPVHSAPVLQVATLFLSSTHHTIVKLFSMGRVDNVRGGRCCCNGSPRLKKKGGKQDWQGTGTHN